MRNPTNSSSRDQQFNMTPMIDVVFLLIIFFLVSSHLAQRESQLPLPLPQAESGKSLPEDPIPRVTLNVLSHGEVMLGGQSLPLDDLRRRLIHEFQERSGRLQVRIRGDRSVPYHFVEPILMMCTKVGIWNVQISVVRPMESSL